jgi:PKD repeat protein/murein DD-endopeptidase MepM/ murein hydrolase activator NlpD
MKKQYLLLLLQLCILLGTLFIPSVSAQTPDDEPIILPVSQPYDLTTEEEWDQIEAEVMKNIAIFQVYNMLPAQTSEEVKFSWPLRAADSLTDYSYYGVSGFVDHDPATGSLLDYMCGDRTYDVPSTGYNHRGTDYFTYPFPWLKMDNDEVEIIAAADGTIVFKRDGQYDRQCGLSSALSNAVVLRHADGTITWYLHMKNGSQTSKAVGDTVTAGEYLGIVGSSGSSTGPHLHFEVRTPANDGHIDPYNGPCNTRPSMWTSQPPYYDPAVIKVHTGNAGPVRPPCPQPEITNIQTTFEPHETVYFVTTYRDLLDGQMSEYRIKRPDDSTYKSWTYTATSEHYSVATLYWSRKLDDDGSPPLGTWTFEVDFEGHTYQTEFYVTAPITIEVLSPNGGETWKPGTYHGIAWDTNIPEDYTEFAIDLYKDSLLHSRITTATPSSGYYFWGIPSDLPASRDYKILIQDLGNPDTYGWSDNPFTIAPFPQAQFIYEPKTGIAPLTVTFTDTSTSIIDEWAWQYGDGMTSTLQNPLHTYNNTGTYTVSLIVTGPTGTDTVTHTDAITVTPPPLTADFTAAPRYGAIPMTVTFTDKSGGPPIVSWTWSFGDGITNSLQHPIHVYEQAGQYTVTLEVATHDDIDVLSVADYIRAVDQMWVTYLPLVTKLH